MVYRALDIIAQVINLRSSRDHKNDFCRLFSASGLVTHLSKLLIALLTVSNNNTDIKAKTYLEKVISIFTTFSSGDSVVKLHMINKASMQCKFHVSITYYY